MTFTRFITMPRYRMHSDARAAAMAAVQQMCVEQMCMQQMCVERT